MHANPITLCSLVLASLLGAGCGCPPTPQEPVRLPDAERDQPAESGEASESETEDDVGATKAAQPARPRKGRGNKSAPPP